MIGWVVVMAKPGPRRDASAVSRRAFLIAATAAGIAGTQGARAKGARQSADRAGPGSSTYKMGILGTGNIAERAVIMPARDVPELSIEAVGSRTAQRGREYADRHRIPRSLDYEALISDPAIDIVYIALPVSLHADWSVRAMEAGKHVLCEKPLASNTEEAVKVADAMRKSGRVYMEAFHYPYHPFARRVRDILDTRAIGAMVSVDASLDIPAQKMPPNNIRRQFALGGGVLMDAGCYPVRALLDILGNFERVVDARADIDSADPQVDMTMSATLTFAGGRQGRLHTTFLATDKLRMNVTVHGERGTLAIDSLFVPQSGGALRLDWEGHSYSEKADSSPSYLFQLRELVRCIRDGAPVLTSADNGILTMRAIDAIYTKAGLRLRGTT